MSVLPTCRDMSARLSEARDSGRGLDPYERLHLWFCFWCRRFRLQLRFLGEVAGLEPKSRHRLSADAKKRLKKALKAA